MVWSMTLEQVVREILEISIKDGLVLTVDGRDPESFSSGELVGPANLLGDLLQKMG